jgi:hypothetical protein
MAELTLEHFNEVISKLATKGDIRNMATKDDINDMATKSDIASIRAEMATKEDLMVLRAEMATKTDLTALQKSMEDYTDQVAETILASVDAKFQALDRRLEIRDHRIAKIESEVKEVKVALNLT